MALIDKLQSIINEANATTGESDADVTAAVQSLIDGYGGGLPDGITELASGTFSVPSSPGSPTVVSHGMTGTPKFACVYNTNFVDDTANSLVGAIGECGKTTAIGGRRVVGSSVWGTAWLNDLNGGITADSTTLKFPSNLWAYAKFQPTNGGQTIIYRWFAWR